MGVGKLPSDTLLVDRGSSQAGQFGDLIPANGSGVPLIACPWDLPSFIKTSINPMGLPSQMDAQ